MRVSNGIKVITANCDLHGGHFGAFAVSDGGLHSVQLHSEGSCMMHVQSPSKE